ncbi:MAG: DHH family phosphoesterase [Bilophila wadsworthia]
MYEQDMQTAHIIQPAEEMAAIIQQFDNIVIVAHGSPDGDAIGATGAMGSLVKALGKRFVLYNATGIPDYLEWVPLPGKLVTKPSAIPFKPGLIIVLDCGDAWRMGKELLAVFPEYPSVNIDHHLGNPMFASLGNWVDPGMAATGQMVAAVADAAGVPLTGELAQCVYLSLSPTRFLHGRQHQCGGSRLPPARRQRPDAAAMRESSTTNGPAQDEALGQAHADPFP